MHTSSAQSYSVHRSGMVIGFGQPTPNSSNRAPPLHGKHSPGPIYMAAAGCKKQALSTKRSMPTAPFSRADRFAIGAVAGPPGPGPGEYIV